LSERQQFLSLLLTGHLPKRSNHFKVANLKAYNREAEKRATYAGRYAEQWRREQAERRKICRTMEDITGRKEDDIQNNGEENRRKGRREWHAESVATLPPFSPIAGQKWFDQISSQ
jgi:hypothetical protein